MKALERRITEMENQLGVGAGEPRITVLCVLTSGNDISKEEQHEAVERYREEHPGEEYPSGILVLDITRYEGGQVRAVNWRDRCSTGAPAEEVKA